MGGRARGGGGHRLGPAHGRQGQERTARARRGDGAGSPAGRGAPVHEKKTPEVIQAIETLMMPARAGDPMTGLKWTRKTTDKVSQELQRLGITVSARTVARSGRHHEGLNRLDDLRRFFFVDG